MSSFGSFPLFNFFQQPNTGSFPSTQQAQNNIDFIQNGGNGASGTVADFNWYFPYFNETVPIQIVEGGGAGFQTSIFSDSSVGLHYGTLNMDVSGNFIGQIDPLAMSLAFSGNAQPLIMDLGNQKILFSGNWLPSPPDSATNLLILSGNLIRDDLDQTTSLLIISGNFIKDFNIGYINIGNSGNIIQDDLDQGKFGLAFSGIFNGILSDSCNISYGFSGIYGSATGTYVVPTDISFFSGDSVNITYMLQTYSRGQ